MILTLTIGPGVLLGEPARVVVDGAERTDATIRLPLDRIRLPITIEIEVP